MEINLNKLKIFNEEKLKLDKNITLIYGRNGTGKSSLANQLKDEEQFNVSVFQGFDNLIDEKQKLNAIILGENNVEVNNKIVEAEKNLSEINQKIAEIAKTIEEPENSTESNLWTQMAEAKNNFSKGQDSVDKLLTSVASKIKNIQNPSIANTNYNKNDLKKELKHRDSLNDVEIRKYKDTLQTEERQAKLINFPVCNARLIIDEVNNILTNKVKEKVLIARLDNDEKINFARSGIEIHSVGEVCAFCGNIINKDKYEELQKYFSADDVVDFQNSIESKIEELKLINQKVDSVSTCCDDFYPSLKNEAEHIIYKIDKVRMNLENVLQKAINHLEEKKKNMFSSMEPLSFEHIDNFENLEEEYNNLVNKNNAYNISNIKEEAKKKLRLHYVKKYLDEEDFDKKISELEQLKERYQESEKEYNCQHELIYGQNGLDSQKRIILDEIKKLKESTTSETLLAKKINKKLKHMVSFQLEHCEAEDAKGYYRVKNPVDNSCRDITELSTGEKNIIAFLYFIEKLDEVKDIQNLKERLIIFDDPMNSNDDGMQYLIMEELQKLAKVIKSKKEYLIILTHNKHFYINLSYSFDYKNYQMIHFNSTGRKTEIKYLKNRNQDFKTSYEELWCELKFLYECDMAPVDLMLNPIRRIIETYTKFNGINKNEFLEKVSGAQKLFNVNSHSIDDLEADLNGNTKDELINILYECFKGNQCITHLEKYCDYYKTANNEN